MSVSETPQPTIPSGYYHCSDRQSSDLAIRYVYSPENDAPKMDVMLDSDHLFAEWTPGDLSFKIKPKPPKFVQFTYDPEQLALIRVNPNTKKKTKPNDPKYVRVGLWPIDLDSSRFLSPDANLTKQFLPEFAEFGCAVVKDIYSGELLQQLQNIHSKFYNPTGNGHSNNRGWYSVHEDYLQGETPMMVSELLTPLIPFLDALLGKDQWEHNNRLQIGFATKNKVCPRLPNYHIDQMFLNKGEPFNVLVGIPLVGEFDHSLSGALAIFKNSHRTIQQNLQANASEINSDTDKAIKICDYAGIRDETPYVIQALPGDVYFTHYRTIHGVTQNYREKDRSVAYLRIRVKPHVRETLHAPQRDRWTDSVLAYSPFLFFPSIRQLNPE